MRNPARSAPRRKGSRIWALLLTLSLIGSASCQATPAGQTQVLRFPWFEPAGSLDPALSFQAYPITINIFQGLVARDDPSRLAEAKKVTASPDGRVWTFELRDDLKWSDGTAITARDYEYAIKRFIDPKTAAPLAFFSYYIRGAQAANAGTGSIGDVAVRANGDRTLTIEFERPLGFAPALLTLWGFWPVPSTLVDKVGAGWVQMPNLVTNGPFVIESWEKDKRMVLAPNPRYVGTPPTVKIELLHILKPFQTDDGVALRVYENGEVDYAEIPFGELDRIKTDATLAKELHIQSKLRPVWVNFDTTSRLWSDLRVRQAFALAIDRDLLSRSVFKGIYKPIDSLVPPTLLPSRPASPSVTFDTAKARQVLSEAGYPEGKGFPDITLRGADNSVNRLLAPALVEQWRRNLGITARIELLEGKTYDQLVQKTYKTQPFDMTIGGNTADYFDSAAYFETWLSTRQEFWNNHWKNADYDRAVTAAGQGTDRAARGALYEQANSILMRELPATPLWLDGWAYLLKPQVTRFDFAFSNVEPRFETVQIRAR